MTEKTFPVKGNISFEDLKSLNEHGAEFWSARELQPLLGVRLAVLACKRFLPHKLETRRGLAKINRICETLEML